MADTRTGSRLVLEIETGEMVGSSVSSLALFNTMSHPCVSVEYGVVINDQDAERSWIRQPLWNDFGKQLAQEVVSDSQVLLGRDDHYLLLAGATITETIAKANVDHGRIEKTTSVP